MDESCKLSRVIVCVPRVRLANDEGIRSQPCFAAAGKRPSGLARENLPGNPQRVISNQRLLELGVTLQYPTFRQGMT